MQNHTPDALSFSLSLSLFLSLSLSRALFRALSLYLSPFSRVMHTSVSMRWAIAQICKVLERENLDVLDKLWIVAMKAPPEDAKPRAGAAISDSRSGPTAPA